MSKDIRGIITSCSNNKIFKVTGSPDGWYKTSQETGSFLLPPQRMAVTQQKQGIHCFWKNKKTQTQKFVI